MLVYALLLPLNLIVSLICYVTNPIVLLFCSEAGELPGILHYWQTWDDSCNPSDIKEIAPGFLRYDWDRHYYEYRDTTPELAAAGRDRCYCRVLDPHFTVWERFQRYCCRVIWLTRNCGYGFSFWLFGAMISAGTVEIIDQIDDERGKKTYARVAGEPVWKAPFLWKSDRDIIPGWLRWNVFLGWKIDYHATRDERAMIAGRIAVKFGRR